MSDKLEAVLELLAKATQENTAILKSLSEKIEELTVSQKKITEDELREQSPLQKEIKYYLQKMVLIGGQETWQDDPNLFEQRQDAENYGIANYGVNKFRILTKLFYISNRNTNDVNNTVIDGEVIDV